MTDRQTKQLEIFKQSLLRANRRLNLFSRAEGGCVLDSLFEESLATVPALSEFVSWRPVLDLGSGNGFPGFVFAVLYPETTVFLCEKRRKRAEFLKQTLFDAKCDNAKVLCLPAENLKDSYGLVLSKATGPFSQSLKILEKVLDKNGTAVFWKSSDWRKTYPSGASFSAKVFKSFSIAGKKKVLVRAQRIKSSV